MEAIAAGANLLAACNLVNQIFFFLIFAFEVVLTTVTPLSTQSQSRPEILELD